MRSFALLLIPIALFAEGKSRITATDMLKIRRVTAVRITADGRTAVYGVQSMYQEKDGTDVRYGYRTHLFAADLDARTTRQLTFGDRDDSGFAISPDGKQLAFVRQDPVSKKPQVWLMPLQGPGEAAPVTRLEGGAQGPVWRPSGKALLVASEIPISKIEGKPQYGMERPGRDWFDFDRGKDAKGSPDGDFRAVRNWLERNAAKDNPTVVNRLAFQTEQGLRKEAAEAQLFSVDPENGDKTTQITKGFRGHSQFAYSPDGKRIAFVSTPVGSVHPDRVVRSAVWLMNSDGTDAKPILDDAKESFSSPLFAADGGSLLVEVTESDSRTRQSRLMRYSFDTGKLELASKGWTSSIATSRFASDGTVLFTSSWHGGAPLHRVRGGRLSPVIEGPVGVADFDEANGRIVYALISASNPNELFVREKDGSTRQVTRLNSRWLAEKQVSLPQEKWIERPGGVKVQSWTMNPIGAEPGKKYPWVLDMHGGPSAMWGPGEFSMWWEFQLFCAWGYGVTYSNPRGSSGYGYEFQRANYKDWGEGPAGDVLSALDDSIRTNPLVDPDQLMLTGGSYAGYLTAWIIGHDHRFKAAAAQRGVYDLTTFYGEGNAYRLVGEHFGGKPYQGDTRRLLEQQSPFTHAARIRTPLLILHGSQDLRTGVSQSEMLYRALKDQEKDVEYVRYPNIGHELTRSGPPLQRLDHMMRIVEFFERVRAR